MGNPFSLDVDSALHVDATAEPTLSAAFLGPRKRRPKKLSLWAQEIVDIRGRLGLTQDAFALAVGESKDRIVNIENGRVKAEDQDLLGRAKSLLDSDFETRVKPLEELTGLSMPQIIDRWWKMIEVADDKEGAVMMGLSLVTVTRWRDQGVRPQARDLLAYELMAKRLGSRKKVA